MHHLAGSTRRWFSRLTGRRSPTSRTSSAIGTPREDSARLAPLQHGRSRIRSGWVTTSYRGTTNDRFDGSTRCSWGMSIFAMAARALPTVRYPAGTGSPLLEERTPSCAKAPDGWSRSRAGRDVFYQVRWSMSAVSRWDRHLLARGGSAVRCKHCLRLGAICENIALEAPRRGVTTAHALVSRLGTD